MENPINEVHILKTGGKRIRHGSYKTVYLCSVGKGKRKRWRAEFQSISPAGAVRLKKWVRSYEEGREWLRGR